MRPRSSLLATSSQSDYGNGTSQSLPSGDVGGYTGCGPLRGWLTLVAHGSAENEAIQLTFTSMRREDRRSDPDQFH